ncbi:MAG: hypothetical protein KGQ52_06815 [Alphaproteobacteria bacterium]|nr:hypothetical protein [Alphaproteobacteria bacterium]
MAEEEAPGSGAMVARLRRLGRVLALISLLFGGLFVVLARRSAALGDNGEIASALFWVGALLQFALAFMLLRRGRKG